MPYQSGSSRRNNVQLGVGQSIWAGTPPPAIPERVLDGIPGFLAWVALLCCIVAAVAFPNTMLMIAVVVGGYNAVRFLTSGVANVIGLAKVRRWEKLDWCEEYKLRAGAGSLAWDDVMHVVLIPNYKEPLGVLSKTLETLARQYEADKSIVIVLAMEAAEDGCVEKARDLQARFAARFAHLFYTVHPRGLPGEMQCKSANQAWAARWVKRKLVDELGYNLDHIVVTTMDADTLWHRNHFFALTCLFATNPDRYLRFWQAPIRYHGNIWEINPLLRIVNAYSTAFELAYLAAPWGLALPMSSYSLSFRLLDACGYWDADVIADEWHMFIKSFFARNAEIKLERVFLPFLAQATTGDTLIDAMRNRYLQTLRHAWGSKEVGYTVAKMLEHPEIDLRRSGRLLLRISQDILMAGPGWIILTVGSQLPLVLNPQLLTEMVEQGWNHPLFAALQIAFVIVTVLGMVFWVQDVIVRPPRTTRATLLERFYTLISFPLLPVLTLIFVAIPTLQAQTRLLIGMPLQFQVTKKK